MKTFVLISIIILSSSAFALDIVFPVKRVEPEMHWKYGLNVVQRVVEDKLHLAVHVNEKLLCDISDITIYVRYEDGATVSTELKQSFGAYLVNIPDKKYSEKLVNVNCKVPSKYNNGYMSFEFFME